MKTLPALSQSVMAYLEELRPTRSDGQFALDVLDACVAEHIVPPTWVLEEIDDCYRTFLTGAPPQGNLTDILARPAPRSLGEAFGVPDLKGKGSMRTRRQKALLLPWLRAMFEGPQALPRTPEGWARAARAHGLTPQQVKDWLPKTRKNTRGHKPYSPPSSGTVHANDPFGLVARKVGKTKK